MFSLRPYQIEDVESVLDGWKSSRSLLGQAATGLGKSVVLAEIARRSVLETGKRTIVIADMGILVEQLAETIAGHTGMDVGIERAEQTVSADFWFQKVQVIVATIQTLYSGDKGEERYRKINPRDISVMLLDETESYFKAGTKYREVIDWFLEQNPDIKVLGVTATPYRTDNVGAINMFDAVAFERPIDWAIRDGWLVPVKQEFVRSNLDFNSLALANKDGIKDYRDSHLGKMLVENEQGQREIAHSIIDVIGDKPAIAVTPDVKSAKAIVDHVCALRPGMADIVHGRIDKLVQKSTFMNHRADAFQLLVSVMMLTKGYDDDRISTVFMCRPTKSKRLYAQVLGRGTRPLKSVAKILGDLPDADARREAIAASDKPHMVMANLVGIDGGVRDLTILDILGNPDTPAEVRERAKEKMADGDMDMDEAIEEATEEVEEESRVSNARRLIQSSAEVIRRSLEFGEDFIDSDASEADRLFKSLIDYGVPKTHIKRYGMEWCRKVAPILRDRKRSGMASYKQVMAVRRLGHGDAESLKLTRGQAGSIISSGRRYI